MRYTQGPIVACSTCMQGNAGLAVLRLSGFLSLDSLQSLFKQDVLKFRPRRQERVIVLDADGREIDDALACFYPAPFSFTGENVLELSVHGNVLHVERLLKLICQDFSFSMAGPGEFTLRAYKNGKLDLAQVEGLDLLLNADSAFVFDQGLAQLNGELHQEYFKLHAAFKQLMASVELSIDFAEDIGEEQAIKLRKKHVQDVLNILNKLYKRACAPSGSLLEPSIVFLGAPNAGKSTLFNHLLSDERSIVSAVAGTTRDYLSESLDFDFARVRLIDTAGLRFSSDDIESEGIKRTRAQVEFAFVRVMVANPFDEPMFPTDDLSQVDLIILSHADCEGFTQRFQKIRSQLPVNIPVVLWGQAVADGPIGANLISGPIGAIEYAGSIGPAGSVKVGPIEPALYIADPSRIISDLSTMKYYNLTKNKPILVNRQRLLIRELYEKFNNFNNLNSFNEDVAILASELSLIVSQSHELIGVYSTDDLLQHIFANFCIGK